jgi:hypothetical protein
MAKLFDIGTYLLKPTNKRDLLNGFGGKNILLPTPHLFLLPLNTLKENLRRKNFGNTLNKSIIKTESFASGGKS